MNYSEVVTLALSYADREDAETSDRMDNFISIVEARINRKLRTSKQSIRTSLMLDGSEYYGLPQDFAGIRDIEIVDTLGATSKETLHYLSPEQLNQHSTSESDCFNYTIISDQLHIVPINTGKTLEIIYYRKLTSLSISNITNWLSVSHPDCYIFGLVTEISAFAKDAEAASLWDARFKESLGDITAEDGVDRWSGPSLQTRVG